MAAPVVANVLTKMSSKSCLMASARAVRRIYCCSNLYVPSIHAVQGKCVTDTVTADIGRDTGRIRCCNGLFTIHRRHLFATFLPACMALSSVNLFGYQLRQYATESRVSNPPGEILTQLTALEYEQVSEETLQSLTEKWEEFAESLDEDIDVNYASGVLTVKLGPHHGTYVINKQTPNKQIWFSSPISGPKRYDYVDEAWRYKYERETLHERLSAEIREIYNCRVDFTNCSHAKPPGQ